MKTSLLRSWSRIALAGAALVPLSCHTLASTFSVDFQGPTAVGPGPGIGLLGGFGIAPIDEGSILTTAVPGPIGPNVPAFGPLPPPGVMVGAIAGAPGSVPGGMGIVPAAVPFVGAVELDALSYGRDFVSPVQTLPGMIGNTILFSVDEFAVGVPGAAPDVFSEGPAGFGEAAADVFAYLGPYFPMPVGPAFGNIDIADGDGLAPFGGPGFGLIEPNPPGPGPDMGDNLDAVDVDTLITDVMGAIYFSLDSGFADPFELAPVNAGTAPGMGFSGGDVLVTFVGGAPAPFIPAGALGLDLAGFDTDDLDALALFENGDGIATPTAPGMGGDEILFSVRRGSAVVGMMDSALGIPIEEGDILTVPGPLGATPAIYMPAELLGLMTTRTHGVGDDLDALDVIPEPSCLTMLLLAVAGLRLIQRERLM